MQIRSSFLKKMFPIFVLQFVSVIILVVTVLIIKFFFNNMFTEIKYLHNEYLDSETSVKEVVETKMNLSSKEHLSVGSAIKTNASLFENKFVENKFALPINSGVISSTYGYRSDPFTQKTKMHKGIDIAAEYGTLIYAVADGEVSYVGFDEYGFGNYLSIKHSNTLKTLYGHCSEILVSVGESVTKGQPIAKVGNSGVTTGSHLHFEIRIDGNCVNPLWYIDFGD